VARKKNSEFLISWMTVTYRSVALAILAVAAAAALIAYVVFPDTAPVRATVRVTTNLLGRLLEKTGLTSPVRRLGAEGPQQAQFTQIEGSVRVKKASSNNWVQADYGLKLEKGDVVQTSSEGLAKIVFADQTNYTIKQDSLIVVEENSTNSQQQTQVAVQVTTGTVDLATATYTQGSNSVVRVAGASASIAPESSAMVRNDPKADQHEILMKRGSGTVTRGTETVALSNWEKVSFQAGTGRMNREKETGPPTLIQPANMAPVYVNPGNRYVEFSWTPVPNTRGYRLRISRNPYFSSTVLDKVVPDTQMKIPGLKEGGYYWVITSLDNSGRESVESERNQFTVLGRNAESTVLALDLEPLVQHGHIIEVKGRTEPSARVMVNGREAPMLNGDGTFQFFTTPLPHGENIITVTAQNAKGAVKTEQKKVVID
jgi:hypothetical protein